MSVSDGALDAISKLNSYDTLFRNKNKTEDLINLDILQFLDDEEDREKNSKTIFLKKYDKVIK